MIVCEETLVEQNKEESSLCNNLSYTKQEGKYPVQSYDQCTILIKVGMSVKKNCLILLQRNPKYRKPHYMHL
eukprot:c27494_g1_i1 orf=87-302(+)